MKEQRIAKRCQAESIEDLHNSDALKADAVNCPARQAAPKMREEDQARGKVFLQMKKFFCS